jgi:hypothetical protein
LKTLSTDAAAAAIGVDRKTLDNLLAREGRSLLERGRRGRSRRIPVDALIIIATAFILNRDLGVGIANALELAKRVNAEQGPVAIGSLTSLAFDVARLREALESSIDEALESVAERTRGRPRAS